MVKKDKKAINAGRKKAAAEKPVKKKAPVITEPKEGFLKSSKAKVCTYRKEKPAYFITWIVIGLILIGIFIWGGAVAYERYQLNQAEKTLDTLAYDIKDALGQPISITKEKSCSYPSTKMETIGRKPNCSVRYELTYPEFTIEDIENVATKIEPIIQEGFEDNTLEIGYGSYGSRISDPVQMANYGQSADKTTTGIFEPNCSIAISNNDRDGFNKIDPYGRVWISCYRTTLIKHFPLIND